jgi:hypothetical protein
LEAGGNSCEFAGGKTYTCLCPYAGAVPS